jgi:hypothetical protein
MILWWNNPLLGNGSLVPVSVATNIKEEIPVTTNGITEDNQLPEMMTYIRAVWQL